MQLPDFYIFFSILSRACYLYGFSVVAELLFLLFGIYLCYRVRSAPSDFAEGTYITAAICYEAVISIVFYVLRFVWWLDTWSIFSIQSTGRLLKRLTDNFKSYATFFLVFQSPYSGLNETGSPCVGHKSTSFVMYSIICSRCIESSVTVLGCWNF